MTESPVTFATFFVIFLQPEPTILSTYRLIREFCLHRRPGSIAAGVFIPITILFTLIFPTAVNSMTGYMTDSSPYVEGPDGKMLPFGEFDKVAYIIHDGKRINKTDDYVLPYLSSNPLLNDNWYFDTSCKGSMVTSEECDILENVSEYTREHGFYGLSDEKTTWMGDVELDAPALNVSAFYFYSDASFFGYEWEDPRTNIFPFRDPSNTHYISGDDSDEMYSMDYVLEHGKCQPSLDVYQWGVSFAQSFIMLIALIVWTVGITIIWYDGHRNLPLVDQPEVPCGWRAIVELARSMEAELHAADIDVTTMTDNKVKREVRQRLRGGTVSFREHRPSRGDNRGFVAVVLAWLRREKWWVFVCVACLGIATGFWFSDLQYFVVSLTLWVMAAAIAAVLALGTTVGSRLLMLSVPILAAVIIVPLTQV